MKRKTGVFDWVLAAVFLFLSVTFLFPFWQILMKSFAKEEQLAKDAFLLFPKSPNLAAYRSVFSASSVAYAYRNTIFRTVVGSALSVAITFAGAYALSKTTLPLRTPIMAFITLTMFFGGGLIPTYLLISGIGLRGSLWVLVLPCLSSAWNVILARNFLYMLPGDIEESAYIDGAGVFRTFVMIVVPLSVPIIAVLALYSVVGHWNAWFDAYIYLRGEENLVLQLLLRRILFEVSATESEYFDVLSQAEKPPAESVTAATIVVTIGPIIAAYPFAQRYFIKGLTLGAVKG